MSSGIDVCDIVDPEVDQDARGAASRGRASGASDDFSGIDADIRR